MARPQDSEGFDCARCRDVPAPRAPAVVAVRHTLWSWFSQGVMRHSGELALSCATGELGYEQLHDRAASMAAGLLLICNLRPGERVALVTGQRLEALPLSLAVQGAGGVELPLSPELAPRRIVELLGRLDCRVAVVESAGLALHLQAAGAALPELRRIVCIERCAAPTVLDLYDLEGDGRRALVTDSGLIERRQWLVEPDHAAVVMHTSGTTGEPKAVLLSHRNLLHSQAELPRLLGLTQSDRVLLCLPLWHLYGRLIAYLALASGASLHLGELPSWRADLARVRPSLFPAFPLIWEELHRDCTALVRGPGAGHRLLRQALRITLRHDHMVDQARTADAAGIRLLAGLAAALSWLPQALGRALLRRALNGRVAQPRLGVVGDAPLPEHVDAGLRAFGFTVLEGYGSTEQIVSCMRSPARNITGTMGQPIPGVQLSVVDAALHELGEGQVGQLAVSGPQVCLGYADRPDLDQAFVNLNGRRAYLSGDLARRGRGGDYVFVGRRANVLRDADGHEIYPELTEDLLRESPSVAHAMLYLDAAGRLSALLVPAPGADAASVQEEAWLALGSSGLAAWQVPKRLQISVEPLRAGMELTPTLKLCRQGMQNRVAQAE